MYDTRHTGWNAITDDMSYLGALHNYDRFWLTPTYVINNVLDGKLRSISELTKILWDLESDRLSSLIRSIIMDNCTITEDVVLQRTENVGVYKIADGHHRIVAGVALQVLIPITIFDSKIRVKE